MPPLNSSFAENKRSADKSPSTSATDTNSVQVACEAGSCARIAPSFPARSVT
ncbi:hypothetical protein D3C83_128890 [compost metagenome]